MTFKTRIEMRGNNFIELRGQTTIEAAELIEKIANAMNSGASLVVHSGTSKNAMKSDHIIYAWSEEEKEETPR